MRKHIMQHLPRAVDEGGERRTYWLAYGVLWAGLWGGRQAPTAKARFSCAGWDTPIIDHIVDLGSTSAPRFLATGLSCCH